MLVAPAASAVAGRRRLKASDLRHEAWFVREDASDTRRQTEAWFRRHRVTPSRAITVHGPDGVKRAVQAGLGVALLAGMAVAEDLASGRLAALPAALAPAPRDVWLVDHPHKHHGAACTAMLAALTASVENPSRPRGGALTRAAGSAT